MKNITTLIQLIICTFLLTSCATKKDPNDSIVIFSSMIKERHDIKRSLISRALSGKSDDIKADAVISTYVRFEGSTGDTITIDCGDAKWFCPSLPDRAGFAKPGEYRLTDFRIGDQRVEYDAEKCGEVKFILKKDEIVYIGGLIIPESIDIYEGTYKHLMPIFKKRGSPDYKKVVGQNFGKYQQDDLKHILETKKFVTRIPNSPTKDLSKDCSNRAIPMWENILKGALGVPPPSRDYY